MSKGKGIAAATLLSLTGAAIESAPEAAGAAGAAWFAPISTFLATPAGVAVVGGIAIVAIGTVVVWKLSSTTSNTMSITPIQSSSSLPKKSELELSNPNNQGNNSGFNIQQIINIYVGGGAFMLISACVCFVSLCILFYELIKN
ncbi:MAG: hypothetical protein RMX63_34680 [Aulosira sp. ZfuCHP01]|nr:hypothetical protein [Aulosira sp. ZfuCHP01]